MTTTRTDTLNDALERLAGRGYLDGPGFADHGPMGAETLSTLGHDDLVAAWVEEYKARHQPLDVPPRFERLDPGHERSWRVALGDITRVSDWAALFRRELDVQAWPEVLQRWAPRLLPGTAGGLTHGLIRATHAVRALPADRAPSGLLLGELARGLAFWAATCTTLPGRPRLRGTLTLGEAIAGLPHPSDRWSPIEAGTFTRLAELEDFPAAVQALGPPPSLDAALSDLTAAFCAVVLANPDVPALPLVHTVTPTAAARMLAPYLPERSIETLYAQQWHVSAAIVAGFTPSPGVRQAAGPSEDAVVPTVGEILARAAEHRDTHAVKFAAACAQEHTLHPDPVYLFAAEHVLNQLPPW